MSIAQRVSTVVLMTLLGACGSAGDDTPREEPPPVKDTAFGDLAGTMDKARGVEDTTMEHKQALDRALQESERPDGSSDQ